MAQVLRWFKKRHYSGLYRATVVDVADPRVQVTFPSLSTPSWAHTLRDLGGMPQVGDQVLVGFEAGDPDFPYVVGVLATGPAPAEVRIDAPVWTFSGVVKADTIVANSVMASVYSPGEGNVL
jgi:type VI secretion system (T6SS) baseplate-like injector VgrG